MIIKSGLCGRRNIQTVYFVTVVRKVKHLLAVAEAIVEEFARFAILPKIPNLAPNCIHVRV